METLTVFIWKLSFWRCKHLKKITVEIQFDFSFQSSERGKSVQKENTSKEEDDPYSGFGTEEVAAPLQTEDLAYDEGFQVSSDGFVRIHSNFDFSNFETQIRKSNYVAFDLYDQI